MTYDEKYDSLPLRGKTTFYGWLRHHNRKGWMDESRRYGRKYHRHENVAQQYWWKSDIIGLNYRWSFTPSKGYKRKTWKDYY
jgi:hypothetical protein